MGAKPKTTFKHRFKDGKIKDAAELWDNHDSSEDEFERRENECVKRRRIVDDGAIKSQKRDSIGIRMRQ